MTKRVYVLTECEAKATWVGYKLRNCSVMPKGGRLVCIWCKKEAAYVD